MDVIQVQEDDFNVQHEYDLLAEQNTDDGAVVMFVGRVRDFNANESVVQLELQHYPGMAEKCLTDIANKARQQWPINRIRIIHRVGKLGASDQIVFVGTTSAHRKSAFEAAEFIMDYLKTDAPFWKKEQSETGESRWVEAQQKDIDQKQRWK
ncbi:molybdopterin synthase catalytic subunit MoaE [Reinekea thalattae]|uniref:Molybdopterin synthase catalytic subunit n=1 Tax=Reinekea thalattae TaxID=2593301 RepID=A0A5C8Z8B0_9GAMM|nr:molybdopterin synthase catalytic subunit MoaE [Reinekea thalattae]TXR53897.1 molybdopterin synthase catalytic subunit MoaE [Reinekea thalattae]